MPAVNIPINPTGIILPKNIGKAYKLFNALELFSVKNNVFNSVELTIKTNAQIPQKYGIKKRIKNEIEESKKTFKKYKWPTIDVTRKSVEETAVSVIKIYEIKKENV